MPVAQSPAHYINSSKGCPSITESFPLFFFFSTVGYRRGIASGATPLEWIARDGKSLYSVVRVRIAENPDQCFGR
jgi:hypothetical protein